MTPLLEASGLSYTPPGGVEILRHADLRLMPGELVWLSGPSGGGKSTLLRLLNRLAEPTAGEIRLAGEPITDLPPTALRRRVGLLPQSPVMLPGDIAANLRASFGLRAAHEASLPDDKALRGLMARLGLDGLPLARPAAELSLGQAQRVALGRLMLMQPQVLLLDEPVSALDPESKALVEEMAAAHPSNGSGNDPGSSRAVLMVSHQPPPGAVHTRGLVLRGGRLEETA